MQKKEIAVKQIIIRGAGGPRIKHVCRRAAVALRQSPAQYGPDDITELSGEQLALGKWGKTLAMLNIFYIILKR